MMWIDWVYLIVAMVLINIGGRYARHIVRKNAPFYGVMNIVIVGATWGVILALAVFIGTRATPVTVLVVLAIWGLLAAAYVGFRPDPIMDWAGKARQTAFVAVSIYIVALANLLFVIT